MLTDGKYVVYAIQPTSSGETHQALTAVFAIIDGGFHLLEDHGNLFSRLNIKDGDKIDGRLATRLESIMHNPYLKLIPASEDGFQDNSKLPVAPQDIHSHRQTFVYQHRDMPGGVPLVFESNHFTLNGYPISEQELEAIRGQVANGEAKMTYPEDMFKSEKDSKSDNEMNRDYICPDIMNLHAYKRFSEKEPNGTHVFLRSDAMDHIMHEEGLHRLKDIQTAVGKTLSEAAHDGKVFHVSRNGYYVNMPDKESALLFLKKLDGLVHQMPKQFSHHPHFDIGVSDTLDNAFHALNKVKGMKIANKDDGNHVAIHEGDNFKYIGPSDPL